MNLRCLIVDDEPIARKILTGYVEKLTGLECIGTCQNGVEALSFLSTHAVDLIFLDINMPEMGGMEVARSLTGNEAPAVVFTTAYPEYAVEGFEVEAVDYLVKPVSFDRFYKAVERVKQGLSRTDPSSQSAGSIFIRSDRKQYQVDLRDILYLEAYGDYVKVHCQQKMILTKGTLGSIEELLPDGLFIRTHRSYIVRFSAIEYIEGNHIRIGDHTLPISQGYRKNLDIS